ncbi:hypothetical protein O181_079671 [Austropuccinia psidii MF-1]|uniref:Reverse transcriptase/retrotransposon-derived protein RNase H-like domain-containing protein n=1 Tax=Austropuccinia psidii MF-1 TaxID=1389203 RepID=A0A9Q3FGP8_9BASI|nr:hypothetical protein [Austropuccinia psidii MF-1]
MVELPSFPSFEWDFLVIDTPKGEELILGFVFLNYFNPSIDWRKGIITINADHKDYYDPLKSFSNDFCSAKSCAALVKADKLSPHRACDHHIVLEGSLTPFGVIYSLSNQESDTLRAYIPENLEKGFIQPSSSSTGAPVLFAEKKDGGLHLCVDYRKLNAVTRKNKYPVPPMNQLLTVFNGSSIFSKIDLRGADNLLRIKEGDEHLTCFRTKYGSYEYLGYVVSSEGLKMDQEKVKQILNWPPPRNLNALQSFLGFANFYLCFIKNYSKKISSFTSFLKKDSCFPLNEEALRQFHQLKEAFTNSPMLSHFDPSLPTIVETDA